LQADNAERERLASAAGATGAYKEALKGALKDALKAETRTLDAARDAFNLEHAALQAQVDAAKQRVAEACATRDAAAAEAVEHKGRLDELRHAVQKERDGWARSATSSQVALDTAQEDAARLLAATKADAGRLLAATKADAGRAVKELKEALALAGLDREIHEQAIEELESEVAQHVSDKEGMSAAADRDAERLLRLEGQLRQANAARDGRGDQLQQAAAEQSTLMARLHEARGQTVSLRTTLAGTQKLREEAERQDDAGRGALLEATEG